MEGNNLASLPFTISAPTISNFSPSSGYNGDEVIITGSNFLNTIAVAVDGVLVSAVQIQDRSTVSITIPNFVGDGVIQVFTANGETAISANVFTIECGFTETTFDAASFPRGWLYFDQDGNILGAYYPESAGGQSGNSLYFNNYDISTPGQIDGILVQNLCVDDFGGSLYLRYNYAYANRVGNSDCIAIYYSLDTDPTLTPGFVVCGENLATAGVRNDEFFPLASEWAFQEIDFSPILTGTPGERVNILLANINDSGNNLFVDNISFAGTSLLPVEWLTFEAVRESKNIELFWSTASEVNNSEFIVERTADIRSEFVEIARVSPGPQGIERNDYFFTDSEVEACSDYYYRIKQIDFDGTVDYSPIRQVKTLDCEQPIAIYPNPVQDVLTIDILGDTAQETNKLRLRLFGVDGVLIKEFDLSVAASNPQGRLTLSIQELPTGTYLAHFINDTDQTVSSHRLVKK